MTSFASPIEVDAQLIKDILKAGHENLTEEQCLSLIIYIPCYVMSLRQKILEAIYDAKVAKQEYQQAFAVAFNDEGGSVEARKTKAAVNPNVFAAERAMIDKESFYEYIKNIPGDWIELQQALKRVLDNKKTTKDEVNGQ